MARSLQEGLGGACVLTKTRHDMGRMMQASAVFAPRDLVLTEPPVLRGSCSIDVCPGCGCPRKSSGRSTASVLRRCGGPKDCAWAAAEEDVALAPAIAWHLSTSAKVLSRGSAADGGNGVRVCCLLALVIQAAANVSLKAWLLGHLRPAGDGAVASNRAAACTSGMPGATTGPHGESTLSYARLFARFVPLDVSELNHLLLVLQTNLFTIDECSIGIYASACLIEHSCRPNARVSVAGPGALLSVHATRRIAVSESVSFSYIDEEDWLARAPAQQRRARLHRELGFYCQCSACRLEEGIECESSQSSS